MATFRAVRRGFTLVELLVSISIIAILVSITMPQLASVRATSRRLKCMTNLKGFGTAFELYMRDSKGMLPKVLPFYQADVPDNPDDPQLLDLLESYMDVKAPYYDENDVLVVTEPFLCPEDKDDDAGRAIGLSYEYWPGGLMALREWFRNDPNPAFTVTRFYEDARNREWPVLVDAKDWHPGNPLTKKNALYFGDWRVDWMVFDPGEIEPPTVPPIPPGPPPGG